MIVEDAALHILTRGQPQDDFSDRSVALRYTESLVQQEEWTFREVVTAALQAAAVLVSHLPDSSSTLNTHRVIAVCLTQGSSLPILHLACHSIECAPAPLDVATEPCERLKTMVDSVVPLLAVADDSEGDTHSKLRSVSPTLTVLLSRDVVPTRAAAREGRTNSLASLSLSTRSHPCPAVGGLLSHVFFTSGTTGTPKAVAVNRLSLTAYSRGKTKAFGIEEGDVVFAASPSTFDPSLGDIFSTWWVGGVLAMAPRSRVIGRELFECLRDTHTNHLLCTPTLLRTLSSSPDVTPLNLTAALPHLRTVGLGGEAMPRTTAQEWGTLDRVSLFNAYGVTECCVYQSAALVETKGDSRVLGSALPATDTVLRVLSNGVTPDREMCTGGPGGQDKTQTQTQTGEVWICGTLVGRGYLGPGSQRENDERFVTVVAGESDSGPSVRCHRTGDIARCDSEGIYHLVGRRDTQVKVRGRRVELDEVLGAVLAGAPEGLFTTAAVTLAGGTLVAWGVPSCESRVFPTTDGEGNPLSPGASRDPRRSDDADQSGDSERRRVAALCVLRGAALRVPSHMLPARVLFCERLPLSSSGKVSLGALARWPLPDDDSDHEGEGLDTGWERAVARVFSVELDVSVRSKHTSFLALGGDSLAALRICQRLASLVRERDGASKGLVEGDEQGGEYGGVFGERMGSLAPAELLQRPTVREFARHLQATRGDFGGETKSDDEDDGDTSETNAASTSVAVAVASAPGYELLREAALAGCPLAVRFLLNTGVVSCLERVQHTTPLHCACAKGRIECASVLLLEGGASATIAAGDGTLPIHSAASVGSVECLSLLLRTPTLAMTDGNGQTAVATAARNGHRKALVCLLDAAAGGELCGDGKRKIFGLDTSSSVDVTAAAAAVTRAVKTRGGKRLMDWRDDWGRTCLHWSAVNGHLECVKALLSRGCDVTIRDNAGETAVCCAERRAQCGAVAGRASVFSSVAKVLGGAGTTKRGKEIKKTN